MTYRDQCLVAVTILSVIVFLSIIAGVGSMTRGEWWWFAANIGNGAFAAIGLYWARRRLREVSK